MKSFATLALFAALATRVAALVVDTPASLVQCLPVRITWREGTAPYFPSVIPGGQPTASPLVTFPQTSDEALTWIVTLPAGTSVNLAVRDSTGEQVFSSALTIQPGSDSSCLDGSSSTSPTASTGPTDTTTGTGGTTSPTVAPGTTTTTGTGSLSRTSTTSTRPSGSTTTTASGAENTNGAVRGSSINALGFAGVMGLLGAALF